MQNKQDDTNDPPVVMKTYQTGNFLIRFLLGRLLKRIAISLSKLNAPKKLGLDIGCGSGNMIDYLYRCKMIKNLAAVDLDKHRLAWAKHHFPVCDYLNMDATALAFGKDTFAYVLAAEIMEHLPEPDLAIEEIRRVSKRDARIIISVPHEPYFRWGNLARGKYWHRGGRTPTHVHFWTRSEFKQFLIRFFVIEAEYIWSVFPWMLFVVRFK